MNRLWRFLGVKRNREILAWVGTGLAGAGAALWAVTIYLRPPHKPNEGPPASISTQGPQSPVIKDTQGGVNMTFGSPPAPVSK